jgi:hypothetical protein
MYDNLNMFPDHAAFVTFLHHFHASTVSFISVYDNSILNKSSELFQASKKIGRIVLEPY